MKRYVYANEQFSVGLDASGEMVVQKADAQGSVSVCPFAGESSGIYHVYAPDGLEVFTSPREALDYACEALLGVRRAARNKQQAHHNLKAFYDTL